MKSQPRILLTLLLSAAAFTGNWFHYPLFFNVDFLFGGFFVMLAVQMLGVPSACIAGAVSGVCTWLIWNHPYAAAIFLLEAAFTAYFFNRRKSDLVLINIIFWCVAGMPLVVFFYSGIMKIGLNGTAAIMFKQAFNGVVMTLASRIAFHLFSIRKFSRSGSHVLDPLSMSLRETIFTLMTAFVIIPPIIGMSISSRLDMEEINDEIIRIVHNLSTQSDNAMSHLLEEHLQQMDSIAGVSGSTNELQRLLEQSMAMDSHFRNIGYMNDRSIAVAFAPMFDETGNSMIGLDLSYRTYIKRLKDLKKPLFSDVLTSRMEPSFPMIVAAAPVIRNGVYRGFVAGAIDIDRLAATLKGVCAAWNASFSIIDRFGNVIASNRPDARVLYPLPSMGSGQTRDAGNGVSIWIPSLKTNTSIMERWKRSTYYLETPVQTWPEWKMLIELPVSPWQSKLNSRYSQWLALSFALLIVSSLIARWLSKRLLDSIEQLSRISNDLPARIERSEQPDWPRSYFPEVSTLTSNVRDTAVALGRRFGQLTDTMQQLVAETRRKNEIEESIKNIRKTVELDERNRIAREMHDGIGQSLQAIKLNLKMQRTQCQSGNPCRGESLQAFIDDITAVSNDLRDIVAAIRPAFLESVTIDNAITWLCERISSRTSMVVNCTTSCSCSSLGSEERLAVFRVCQEALSNAMKHSGAKETAVSLSCSDTALTLSVRDNGCGGAQEKPGESSSGLAIMRERMELVGGTIYVDSPAGAGTTIIVEVPLK